MNACLALLILAAEPKPIPGWVNQRMAARHKSDGRVPIMPPIRPGFGFPECAKDLFEESEVFAELRILPENAFREDVRVIAEKVEDEIAEPRFFPLVGPAQWHRCKWKCTVTYTEVTDICFLFTMRVKSRKMEIVHISKDHLHLVILNPPRKP